MRVLVCGGRNFDDADFVWERLDFWHEFWGIDLIIHGGAKGADLLAEKWAISHDITHISFKPGWSQYGPAAGPLRNKKMLDEGRPDMVLAFPGGRGTADMVYQAHDAGLPVVILKPMTSK